MHTDTGEIRIYEDIPKQDIADRKWSDPFAVGDLVEVKGVTMEITRIKQLRGELVLKHPRRVGRDPTRIGRAKGGQRA